MGKHKPIILLGAALIVALITSVVTYNWLKNKIEVKDTGYSKTQSVAVAAIDLSWGTVLNKDVIKTVTFLKESLPGGVYSDASSLDGRVLIYPVKANEPILESRLAPSNVTAGGVAAIVNRKKRAMAIKVDKVIGVSGFIHPGNRVDVLVTLKSRGRNLKPITKTVLENVLVLAIGTELENKGKSGKSTNVDVITLEVTPDESEKLAHATTQGKIQLAIRNFNDTDIVYTKGANNRTLLASYRTNPKKSLKSNPTYTVEVIKGSETSKVRVKGR